MRDHLNRPDLKKYFAIAAKTKSMLLNNCILYAMMTS